MPLYQRGSKGPEVTRIQTRLKELGDYRGPLDGDFGGGTEAAVRSFQRRESLSPDGKVGSQTWTRLFPQTVIPTPAVARESLSYRTLALTGTFETDAPVPECFAGLSGDFDGQGLSFGALQWNFGQGSLQPLLREMNDRHPQILREIFDDETPVLVAVLWEERDEQLAWARSVQDARYRIAEPWRGYFKALGRTDAFQEIELKAASRLYQEALALCEVYGVRSERAAALMFDIKTQNGSIRPTTRAQIERDFRRIPVNADPDDAEIARLRIIANRRAEACIPRWIEDVRRRKLAIANGQGTVHGRFYDLEEQFGIRLSPWVS